MVDDGDGVFRPDPGGSSPPRSRPARGATPGCSRLLRPRPAHGLRRRTRTAWPPSSGNPTTPARRAPSRSRRAEGRLRVRGHQLHDARAHRPPARRASPARRAPWADDQSQHRVTIGPNQYARCTVRNRINPGRDAIEIEKSANPQSRRCSRSRGVLGNSRWWMTARTAASRTSPGLAPGTYTVSELVRRQLGAHRRHLRPAAAAVVTGAEAVITSRRGSPSCVPTATRGSDPPPRTPSRRCRPPPADATASAAAQPRHPPQARRGEDGGSRRARRRPGAIQPERD